MSKEVPELKDIYINGVKFDDRDFHCISRFFQSIFFAPEANYFYGCNYCKYSYECSVNLEETKIDLSNFNMIRLRDRLSEITGVDTGPIIYNDIDIKFKPISIQELYPEKAKKLKLLEQKSCYNQSKNTM